jgi:hypothetical protein
VFHAPAALLLEKNPLYSLDRRLGWLQSRSERGGEEKNSQPLPGLEPPIIQPVAQRYTAELSWPGNTRKKLHNEELRSLYFSPVLLG